MPNAEKIERVAVLTERIRDSRALLVTEYRGLSVHDATELRRSLSGTARFSVVKNTLMRRAAGEAGVDELERLLEGPTAVAFVFGDPITAAKRIADAAKRFPALVLKGAYVEGKVLLADDARGLADLESREVMLSRISGALRSEMSRAVFALRALQGRFLALLDAYREEVPAGKAGGPGPPAPHD
jgi:large subunit ribosomal protein L10